MGGAAAQRHPAGGVDDALLVGAGLAQSAPEVEQVIEPARSIGARPTVQLGLDSDTRTLACDGEGHDAPVFTGDLSAF
jgi:hypothetical protein